MRAIAEGRGEGPVEPGLGDLSTWLQLGMKGGNSVLEVIQLNSKVLTSM